MLCQPGGYGRRGPRSTADPDGPVRSPDSLGIELAHHPYDVPVEEAPVTPGDGLLGGSENLGQPAERRARVEVQGLDDPSVQYIERSGFHRCHGNSWNK